PRPESGTPAGTDHSLNVPLSHQFCTAISSRSASSRTSSCVLGDTFGNTRTIEPSPSMMNVARRFPQYVRPYIDFSAHTPYCSATEWSASASRVKFSDCLSWNFLTSRTESGETPSTTAPVASYSDEWSRIPHACVVHPGVSALG